MGNVDKIISVAEVEVGYLEKKSNKDLNSKTANAGTSNYTKYGAWYGVLNNDSYDKYKGKLSIPMVYAMDSRKTETRNAVMISHIMKVFNALDIQLLKSPHEGVRDYQKKNRLTAKDIDDSPELEIPYILTDNLCEEIMNLEYRQAGNEGKIEQISGRIPKDKFSALMYGLWWIYMRERQRHERNRYQAIDMSMFKPRKADVYGRGKREKAGWY